MIQFLKALLLLPLAIVVVLLAVANRAPVRLSFDPFSREAPEFSLTLPLFAVVFIAVAIGVVIGGMASWFAQAKHRRGRRRFKREASDLRAEGDRLRQQTGVPPGLTALPAPQGASRL